MLNPRKTASNRNAYVRRLMNRRLFCVSFAATVAALAIALPAPVTAVADLLAGGEIVSRPTNHSVTVRAIAGRPLIAAAEWRTDTSEWTRTAPVMADAGDPFDIIVDGLAPNTAYAYRLVLQANDQPGPPRIGEQHAFHTQRAAGDPFTFVVQADPHLDENSSGEVYGQTLANELADAPDFLIDLGDAAMSDRCVINRETLCERTKATAYAQVAARNALMREQFARIAHSVPLFLTLGNHEAEAGWATVGAAATLANWSFNARTFFYANPVPDDFFTGNDRLDGSGQLRQNYYAFEWGDALFVVLDPFAYTMRKPTQFTDADMWSWTLGDAQYHWLADTLAGSRARYKFVFSHHIVGGGSPEARGAAAFASMFEWGGHNRDGSWGFSARRPGWEKPIHQLMLDAGVNIFFHGHDHLYAREGIDGIVYQCVPQPSTARYQGPDLAREYGYLATPGETAFVTPGHLRVSLDTTGARVDFVRSVTADDETSSMRNRAVLTSYSIR